MGSPSTAVILVASSLDLQPKTQAYFTVLERTTLSARNVVATFKNCTLGVFGMAVWAWLPTLGSLVCQVRDFPPKHQLVSNSSGTTHADHTLPFGTVANFMIRAGLGCHM